MLVYVCVSICMMAHAFQWTADIRRGAGARKLVEAELSFDFATTLSLRMAASLVLLWSKVRLATHNPAQVVSRSYCVFCELEVISRDRSSMDVHLMQCRTNRAYINNAFT